MSYLADADVERIRGGKRVKFSIATQLDLASRAKSPVLTRVDGHMPQAYQIEGDEVRMEVWGKLKGEPRKPLVCRFSVDDFYLLELNTSAWYANPAKSPAGKWYVNRKVWNAEKKLSETVLMHREILGLTDPEVEAHHKDNDGLNNRRDNLEPIDHKGNMRKRNPNADWAARDEVLGKKRLYAAERRIAQTISSHYRLSRAQIFRIRNGIERKTLMACELGYRCRYAFEDYHHMIRAAGLKTLGEMMAASPREGKWGVWKSGYPVSAEFERAGERV